MNGFYAIRKLLHSYHNYGFRSPNQFFKSYSTNNKNAIILGIETSCDDTGCAVMDERGNILGEAINSQLSVHVKNGGIIPPIAQDLHRKHIGPCVDECLRQAKCSIKDLDAIAVNVKPGMPLSLSIGLKYAKYLARNHSKPIIPIHHMEAHALTARIEYDVEFPFLCLLISGGHCILALVNDVDDFRLLGETIDDSPGEAFDKLARRLKLHNVSEFSEISGGAAIEAAARRSQNPERFPFPPCLTNNHDCNFSISGLKSAANRHIIKQEAAHEIEGGGLIPDVYDLCAAFQIGLARHLTHRTYRAMKFVEIENLIPAERRTLVVSGGSACNNYIHRTLEATGELMNFKVVRPRPKLCTDNGIMIAWNGIEKWKKNLDIVTDFDEILPVPKCPLGTNIVDQVCQLNIKCKLLPMDVFYKIQDEMREPQLCSKDTYAIN